MVQELQSKVSYNQVISSVGHTFLVHPDFLGPQVLVACLLMHATWIPASIWLKLILWYGGRTYVLPDLLFLLMQPMAIFDLLVAMPFYNTSRILDIQWKVYNGQMSEWEKKNHTANSVPCPFEKRSKIVKTRSKSNSLKYCCLACYHCEFSLWNGKGIATFGPFSWLVIAWMSMTCICN